MEKRITGKIGEKYAQDFLISQNYQILKNNYYCRMGEIDLITKDPTTHELVFVEIKTRITDTHGTPEDSLTHQKRHKILKTVFHFLEANPKSSHWRIDLIALKLNSQGALVSLNHLKNVLDE